MIDIIQKTLKHIKFIIERYTQKSDKKSVSHYQCMRLRSQTSSLQFFSDWAIDRVSLWAAICEFDSSTEDLQLDSFNMIDRSSVSVNLTRMNIQQIIDATIQQVIIAALQAQKITDSQTSQSQSQLSLVKDNDYIIVSLLSAVMSQT